jgi:hypothetical protein
MNESLRDHVLPDSPLETPVPMFMWRGAGIVLLGERDGDRFVLARGWLRDDRLTDVRRWSFKDRHRFSVQVRRLVVEAGRETCEGVAEGARALDWAESAA